MLAQRHYTPSKGCLTTIRRDAQEFLKDCPCNGTQQRVLLAVNEIVTNILRHTTPAARDIRVEFVKRDGNCFATICDNGGSFTDFGTQWRQAAVKDASQLFIRSHVGLAMIRRLWPEAFYEPRKGHSDYNRFVLPLTAKGMRVLPRYFHPPGKMKWAEVMRPLMRSSAR